ncbi:MAG TPA: aldose 1-epimerase [Chloroflexia bacterium]|nr:aldose 1-epimerase [Chloroflexia bacterium]
MKSNDASFSGSCFAEEVMLPRSNRAIRLENEFLSATVLVDKGADIYQLIYKPQNMDVLWKSPWGLRPAVNNYPSTFRSEHAWLEVYEGGWQEIFPNGGDACDYRGVELNFHGEASLSVWDYWIVQSRGAKAEIYLSTRLRRSPFRLERRMSVEAGKPTLSIQEKITNEGGESLEFMWGHHPAFGAPFLGPDCRVDTGASTLVADDRFDGPANPLQPGQSYAWPQATREGQSADLSLVPGKDSPRHTLAYLSGFDADGWYGITNTRLGFGVGLVWPTSIFPHAWFWQEMHASSGFPWYKSAYVMALEPFSSFPSQGLQNVKAKTGTQRELQPGEVLEAEIQAVFYESRTGVSHIDAAGNVQLRNR